MNGEHDYDMVSPHKLEQRVEMYPVHGEWLNMILCVVVLTSLSFPVVEVRVLQGCTARFDTIRNAVHTYITASFSRIYLPSTLHGWEDVPLLAQSVDRIIASESTDTSTAISIEDAALQIHVYQPNDIDAVDELASGGGRGDGEEVTAASVCELPSLGWEGLWESLIYGDDIKAKLLDYIYATVIFSDADVDCEWVLCNFPIHYLTSPL